MQLLFSINNAWYLVITLMGILIIIQTARRCIKADASLSWSGVQGRIVASRIERYETTYRTVPDIGYRAVVRYTYTVMGQEYTGDRVAFVVRGTNRDAAEHVIDRYPAGKSVMVYYNPEKPQEAVLEHLCITHWFQIVIGVLLIIVGGILAIG